MPIGNLTSQIFSNIYLNELDRFVVHTLKPQAYARYGDDFILIAPDKVALQEYRLATKRFLADSLHLAINPKHDILQRVCKGLSILGVEIFQTGRHLQSRSRKRAHYRLTATNLPSYWGLYRACENEKQFRRFAWYILERYGND